MKKMTPEEKELWFKLFVLKLPKEPEEEKEDLEELDEDYYWPWPPDEEDVHLDEPEDQR